MTSQFQRRKQKELTPKLIQLAKAREKLQRGPDGRYLSKNPPPAPVGIPLDQACFSQQLDFINDPAPFVTASCSRRAGKSSACARDLVNTCLLYPGVICGYITLTSRMAKRILWRELKRLDAEYKLGAKFNLVELSITFQNDSLIYLSGCANESEMDKFLGVPLKLLYLDEVQSFRAHIGELIDRVIAPSLMDYDGKLKLIGTPALLQSGYFWNAINSDAYSHHHWTYWDNPFIPITSKKTHQELLDRELKRRGVSIDDPSIRREWFGEWRTDDGARVFKYDPARNDYQELPELTEFVISVDIGYYDADAIAVIGWPKHDRTVYLVEELVVAQQGVTDLAQQIERLVERYKPLKLLMDTGGLGKKIAEELRKRFSLPIVAAEKTRKIEFIELLNDALRTGAFKARTQSRFAVDSYVVEWDHNRSTPDKRVIKDDPHSDIADAVLYGYRESLHWLAEPKHIPININNRQAWIAHTEKLMEERLQEDIDKQTSDKYEYEAMQRAYEDEHDTVKRIVNQRRGK